MDWMGCVNLIGVGWCMESLVCRVPPNLSSMDSQEEENSHCIHHLDIEPPRGGGVMWGGGGGGGGGGVGGI